MHHEVFPCIGADGFPGMSHVANFLLAEWPKHAKAVLACYASSQDCIDNYLYFFKNHVRRTSYIRCPFRNHSLFK